MDLYQVGPTAFSEFDVENIPKDRFVWCVYDYKCEEWEGGGEVVLLGGDGQLYSTNLGHCSCHGPMENFNGGLVRFDPLTAEELFRDKDGVLDRDWSPGLKAKVKELLEGVAC